MSEFNAKAARAKRPCPIWVDAFQRDTQHLEADEIGAYFLILIAMWTRESCDFPDDDSRLARVSRVSTRLWKSRIGPILRELFGTRNGSLISKRLREEATYTERQVQQQSDRKKAEKSDKPLENKEPASTADTSTDEPRTPPREHPTQLPNYPTVIPDTDVSGGDDAPDEKEIFWNNAKEFLRRKNVPVKQIGSFIGKCLRDHGLDKAREAFRAAQVENAVEPIGWISAVLNKTHSNAISEDMQSKVVAMLADRESRKATG